MKFDFLNRTISRINKLRPEEFLGICQILGIELYEDGDREKPKTAEALMDELLKKLGTLNRTQKRNLEKLLKAATGRS